MFDDQDTTLLQRIHRLISAPVAKWENKHNKLLEIAFLADIDLHKGFRMIKGVLGHINGNGVTLRRSAQLLLVVENDHFGGRTENKVNHNGGNLKQACCRRGSLNHKDLFDKDFQRFYQNR